MYLSQKTIFLIKNAINKYHLCTRKETMPLCTTNRSPLGHVSNFKLGPPKYAHERHEAGALPFIRIQLIIITIKNKQIKNYFLQ